MATFSIGEIGYWAKAFFTRSTLPVVGLTDLWVLGFGVDDATSIRLYGHKHAIMKPTGLRQSPATVLTTVQTALDEFIGQTRPARLWMSDTDDSRGRKRLYGRYADHLITRFRYVIDAEIVQSFEGKPVWCLKQA